MGVEHMTRKSKLVFKTTVQGHFEIAKVVNTLEYGAPGDIFTRKEVDNLLHVYLHRIMRGELTVEFINRKD